MKMFIVFACVIVAVIAVPIDPKDVTVLKYDNDNIGVDGYNFAYELSDGVSRQESGQLKNAGTDEAFLTVRGTVSWVATDGQTYTLNYVADETGYHPEGDFLPKA